MPTIGISTVPATAATWATATARIAGPDSPPERPPSQASTARSDPHRPQRVDQRDRVGAAVLRGRRGRGPDVGAIGRQLDDQRLGGERSDLSDQFPELAGIGADVEAGADIRAADTFSSNAATSVAVGQPDDQLGELGRCRPHHVGDQRHAEPAEHRQVGLDVAVAGRGWAGRSS